MFRFFLNYFLVAHLLGDYYFQSEKLAIQKEKSFRKVIHHNIIYGLVTMIWLGFLMNKKLIIVGLALIIIHAGIDIIKWFLCSKYKVKNDLYVLDQILHLLTIISLSIFSVAMSVEIVKSNEILMIESISGVSLESMIKWLSILLIIDKPLNITISKLLKDYKLKDMQQTYEGEVKSPKNAGSFIGTLERLIIVLLISLQQYSAIGLVITAKSIARYNKISEEKEFSEYYLLGTLLSTTLVIITGMLLM